MPPLSRRSAAAIAYPMMRFPWERTEAALRRLAGHGGDARLRQDGSEAVELDDINPETGQSCLPTMGFTAMMLRPGEVARPRLRSAGAVFHVVAGRGSTIVNGVAHAWGPKDTFSAPVFAEIEHKTTGDAPAFLVRIHDTPLQEKIGYTEERAR